MKKIAKWQNNTKIVIKNSAYGAIGSVVGQALAMLSSIIMGRITGASGLGAYSFGMTLSGVLFIFLNLGLGGILQRNISRDRTCAEKYLANTLSIKVFFSMPLVIIIAIPFSIALGHKDSLIMILLCCIYTGLSSVYNTCSECITALENFDVAFRFSLQQKIINLILTAGLLYLFHDMTVMLVGYIIGFFIPIIGASIYIRNNLCDVHFDVDFEFQKRYIQESAPAILSAAAEYVNLHCDILILSYFKGEEVVGFYSVATSVYIAATFIPIAMAKAATPTFNRILGEGGNPRLLVKHTFYAMLLSDAVLILGVVLLGKHVIPFLYGQSFTDVIAPLNFLSLGLFAMPLNRFWGYLLVGMSKQKKVACATLVGATINLILNVLLIPQFGMYAAVFTTLVSETIVAIIEGIILYRNI